MEFFNKSCLPVQIYIILVALGIFSTLISDQHPKEKAISITGTVLYAAFWGFIMTRLCKTNKEGWAWFILLFPMLLWIGLIVLIAAGVLHFPLMPIQKM